MARWLTFVVLPLLVLGLASCGGGGDDDDDNSGDPSHDDGGRTDSSNATGSLSVAGKDYTLDMQTCELSQGASKLTVLAGTVRGEKNGDFSASGIEKTVAIAVRFGESGYIAVGAEMGIDGKSVKWEGDLTDPADPGKPVKGKFSLKC
jgi:hypothetical protein